jgi:LysM domain
LPKPKEWCRETQPVDPRRLVIRTRRKPKGQQELLAAAALVAYLIHPGDTLSGIASNHGVSLASVEAANPQIKNPNLIYAGQTIKLPKGSSASHRSHTSSVHTSAYTHRAPSHRSSSGTTRSSSSGSSGYSSSSLSDIPGVPQSFAACVAYRESTDLQNPAARGNAYGIIPASGYNVYGTSLAHQKQVFAELYRQYGTSPWAADGC